MTIKRTERKSGPRWRAVIKRQGRHIYGPWRPKRWQASEDEAAMMRARELGTLEDQYGPDRMPTFAEAAADYLHHCRRRVEQGDLAPRTLDAIETHLDLHLVERFGELRIDEISVDLVEVAKRSLYRDLSGPTVNRYLATLSGVFRYFRHRCSNPVAGIERYDENTDAWQSIGRPEVERIVAHARGGAAYLDTVVLLLFELCARISEIRMLRWEQIEWGWTDRRGQRRGLITWPTTKAGEAQTVPLTLRARDELRRQKRRIVESPWCFPSPVKADRPIGYEAISEAWKRALRDLEMPTTLRLHDLRHGRATQMIEAGVPPHKAQRAGRWRSRASMDRYVHMSGEHAAEAWDQVDALPDEAAVEQFEKARGDER